MSDDREGHGDNKISTLFLAAIVSGLGGASSGYLMSDEHYNIIKEDQKEQQDDIKSIWRSMSDIRKSQNTCISDTRILEYKVNRLERTIDTYK